MQQTINKIIAYILSVTLLLSMTACGKNSEKDSGKNTDTNASCYQLALAMAASEEDGSYLAVTTFGDDNFDSRLQFLYGITDSIANGCVIYSITEYVTEFAVIKMKNEDAVNAVKMTFENYIHSRIGAYYGYFPDEVNILENSYVFVRGKYVVLNIGRTPKAAEEAFDEVFGYNDGQLLELEGACAELAAMLRRNEEMVSSGSEVEEPTEDFAIDDTNKDDDNNETGEIITSESQLHDQDDSIYFNQDIVTAYLNNTPEILKDEKDIAIYERVVEILSEIITDDMTDLMKEKAVHDYMCMHMDYDRQAEYSSKGPMPDSDNPYGMLVNGYGICLGYATTFLLFMDCLEIECMIVEGRAYDFTEAHAWNKVYLDGTWYCVDVTWDDPVYTGGPKENVGQTEWYPQYTYFNCSDDDLAWSSHLWNREEYPESPKAMPENMY